MKHFMNKLSFILLIAIIFSSIFTTYVHVCHVFPYNFTMLVPV